MNFEKAAASYERGDLKVAWEACAQALDEQRPDHRLLHLMGLIAYRQQRFVEAQSLLERAIELSPNEPLYFCNLALPYLARGDYTEAIARLDQALALMPAFLPALEQKSATLMQLNRAREALPLLDALVQREATPRRVMSLALCHRSLGQLDEARAILSAMLAEHPDCGQAWWLLTGMSKATQDGNHVAAMRSALAMKMSAHDRVPLLFAMARELEDLGDVDEGFEFYFQANTLRRQGINYDIENDAALYAGIVAHDSGPVQARRAAASNQATPIFIVSMPRTGSTLVERILGAHSEVCAAGELQLAGGLVRACSARKGQPYPASIPEIGDADLKEMSQVYLERSREWRDDSPFFVDKMPINFLYLGVIARMFPDAPLIHVQRDPVDTCLSCYRQLFGDYYQFSYELEELGRWYGMYRDLMTHWNRIMPGRILNLEYEELVRDPEAQARRLLAHCGLVWERGCLEFMAGGGAVSTPSAEQVRRGIYQDSVGRWRRYESHLGALLQALGEHSAA